MRAQGECDSYFTCKEARGVAPSRLAGHYPRGSNPISIHYTTAHACPADLPGLVTEFPEPDALARDTQFCIRQEHPGPIKVHGGRAPSRPKALDHPSS